MDFFTIIIVVIAILIVWIIFSFNALVKLKNRAKEAWSDIEVQLKRRYNLIPSLVETVKGYAAHEREVLEKVTEARAKAMGAQTMKEKGEAENFLSQTLKSLFAVVENYPDLKASQNFLELQRELRDTEDKIQAAAKLFGFKKMDLFEIEEAGEREVPKVEF